jgi:phage repressor protein C with HTH and peptisase S24 domain
MNYREWILRGLSKDGKTKGGLAKYLKLDPAQVTRMLAENGKPRRIQAQELEKIADYIEEPIPSIGRRSARMLDSMDDVEEAFDASGERISMPIFGIRELDSDAGLGAGHIPQVVYRQGEDGPQITDAYKPEPWVLPSRYMRGGLGAPAEKIIAIATRGDSMFPTVGNGDVVFIDTTNRKIGSGTLHAMRDVYGDIVIKRLEIFRDGSDLRVNIMSDNKNVDSRMEHADEIDVVGRVCGIFKMM